LVGWWTGDGNTVDIGGSNSGTLQNGATYSNGEVGQAFSFAGNGASVLINSPVYSPSAGTLMFWFLAAGAGPEALTGGYAGGANRAPGFSIDSGGNLNWEFANLSAQPVGQVSSNQWNHAALTYSTSNSETALSVYLNGTLVADADTDANTSWNPQVAFGAYLGGAQQPSFAGSMDEIAIFNQALSAQQIEQIYNAFSGGICKPTLQTITINPAIPSIAVELSLQFDAVGSYSDLSTHDLTTSSNWSTADPTVATIGAGGLVTGVGSGSTTISATLGLQGSTSLTVGPSLVSIQVNPQNPSLDIGAVQPVTATARFSDGTQQNLTAMVSWTSSAPTVASVSTSGQVTAVAAGQATITATSGSVSGSTRFTVTSATLHSITVSPANLSVATGATQQFTATGTFTDGTQQNLTTAVAWSSSAPGVATIASTGLSSGVSPGQTRITATLGSVSRSVHLTVTTATLAVIEISPPSPVILIPGTEQLTATGLYTDGSTANITTTATWVSSSATVATISNTSGTQGLATSVGVGTAGISASLGSLTASTTLTVQDQLISISVAPATVSLAVGSAQQFTATGTYASGIPQDLTESVTWSSSEPNVAAVSSSGSATSLTSGQTNIEASIGSVTALANLMVVSPDPLGTANGTAITCEGNTLNNGTCYAVTISCPNTVDLTGYLMVNYPVGTPSGTVLFSTGANGTYAYGHYYTYGTMILNNILEGGFTVVQISWGEPFTNQQPYGWQTGPGGIRAVACRYATLAQWIYTNIHLANTAAPFCGTGNSGATEPIGESLAHYGQGSIFAMVEETSGPVFARQDWACDCPATNAVSPCGVYGNFCLGAVSAEDFVDPAYALPVSCSYEILNHSNIYDTIFYNDSVVAPDSVFAYPNTFVNFLYGSLDSAPPTNQGHTWASAITSSKAESCVPNTGHGMPNFLPGAQQISSDILNYCKLATHGQP
jgi:uncharacterized protein YjdB